MAGAIATAVQALPDPQRTPLRLLSLLAGPFGVSHLRNIAFGPHSRHRLDVYRPAGSSPGPNSAPSPCLLFLYGGRWSSGHRTDYAFVGRSLARRGIITVVADYRLYPEVRFPAFVEDAARALAFVQERAREFGTTPQRIAVGGHSAGAHIASLLALNADFRRYPSGNAHVPSLKAEAPAAVVGISGPYDFLPLGDDIRDIFGPESGHRDSQPIHWAGPGKPPFLLLHGEEDRTVGKRNSRNLAAALDGHGVPAEVILYPGVDHTRILAGFVGAFRVAPLVDDISRFLTKTLGRDG